MPFDRNKGKITVSQYSDDERMNAHGFIPKNENPWLKLRAFRKIIASGESTCEFALTVLEEFLNSKSPDIAVESLSLLSATMRVSEENNNSVTDTFFSKVVGCLGSQTPQVRMGAVSCLYAYSTTIDHFESFINLLIQHGLENSSTDVRTGCIIFINTFASVCGKADIHQLTFPLVRNLNQHPPASFHYMFHTLKHFHRILGQEFPSILKSVNSNAYDLYQRTLDGLRTPLVNRKVNKPNRRIERVTSQLESCTFFSQQLLKEVIDDDEVNRCRVVRKVRALFRNCSFNMEEFRPHLETFLKFLDELLDDAATKVKLLSLDILAEVIEKITCDAVLYVQVIVRTLFKTMSCRQQPVKKQGFQILQSLMQYVHPMVTIRELLQKIHQSSAIKVEVINRITIALSSFPLHCFDIEVLFQEISPLLEDFVLNVRQAAFECFVTLSFLSIAKGESYRQLGNSLVTLYGVNKATANLIMKRVKNRSLPQSQLGRCFNEVSCPGLRQTVDSTTMDEISNDSFLTMTCSELEDAIQPTSFKKKSIFTINCAIPETHNVFSGEKLPFASSSEGTVTSVLNRTINKPSKTTPGDFSADRKLSPTNKGQMNQTFDVKGYHPISLSQNSNNSNQRSCSSKREDFPEGTHNSTESFPSLKHFESESDSKELSNEEMKHSPKYENSSHRNTSTPESESEELSECFKQVEEQFSILSLEDSHQDKTELCSYHDNTVVSYSSESVPSILQSVGKISEKYSYITNSEQGEGDFCVIMDADSTLSEDKINASGISDEESCVHDMSSQHSPTKNNSDVEMEDGSIVEKQSIASSLTIESLPFSQKNFNILVIEQRNNNKPLYIEEIFDSCSDFAEKGQSEVNVVIDYPPTSTPSIEELGNETRHRDTAFHEEHLIITEEESIADDYSERCPTSGGFSTTLGTADNSQDNDNNYDADESQPGSTLGCAKNPRKNYCKQYKQLNNETDLTEDNILESKKISKTRSSKLKEQKHTFESCLNGRREETGNEENVMKKVVHKLRNPSGESSVHNGQKNAESASKILSSLGSSLKSNDETKPENYSLKKKSSEIVGERSQTLGTNDHQVRIKSNDSSECNNKGQRKAHCDSVRPHDPNKTHVVKKQHNAERETRNGCDVEKEVPSNVSLKNNKPCSSNIIQKQKENSYAKLQQNTLGSGKIENQNLHSTPKRESLENEENEILVKFDTENSFPKQLKLKRSSNRRASYQWIENIDFLNRSQNCSWADTLEKRIRKLKPFKNDESDDLESLKEILETLQKEDITNFEDGILKIIRVATFNPQIVNDHQLNQIIISLIGLTKSFKPCVAGQAVLTIGHLFMILKRPFESKFKLVIRELFQKSGTRIFGGSYNAVMKSLFYILKALPIQKAIPAFISEGSSHHNKKVRETTAQFLSILIKKLGPSKSLLPAISKIVITTAAAFAMDGSPMTRHCGKLMFAVLMEHPNFDDLKEKFLSDQILLSISKILKKIKSDGVEKEDMPIYFVLKELCEDEKWKAEFAPDFSEIMLNI